MSDISGISARERVEILQQPDRDEPQTMERRSAGEPDWNRVGGLTVLPTGLLAATSPRPTAATLKADAKDLRDAGTAATKDLKDPHVVALLESAGDAGLDVAQIIGGTATIVNGCDKIAAAEVAPPAAIAGALQIVAGTAALANGYRGLLHHIHDLLKAGKDADPALHQLATDVHAFIHAAEKLAVDAEKAVLP